MSIKVALEHHTAYEFARPVTVQPHVIRLRPAPHSRTPIEAYSLEISPKEHFINWQQDPFGNWLARVVFPEKVSRLEITVGLVADMMVVNPLDFFIESYAERFPFAYQPALAADLAPYLRPVGDSDRVGGWMADLPSLPDDGVPTVKFLADLNRAVYRDVGYSLRMEAGVQTPDHTLESGIGSCRDSAWLLVSILRRYGLAARFVSGYLVQLAPDRAALDGPAGPTQDFTDLHAWAEVFVPGAGWIGLDPTSALFAGEGHIPLSATPHPSSAAPISGSTEPVEVTFSFRNEVRRVHEDPRTTRPYTPQQWTRIDALGEAVDERLEANDVRLTMGGEPTFVSLDDARSPQWRVAADGPEKRELAERPRPPARDVFAKGGAVHRGQGKWYPGEAVPRWAIALRGAPTASRCGRIPLSSPTRGARMPMPTPPRSAERLGSRIAGCSACRERSCCPRSRIPSPSSPPSCAVRRDRDRVPTSRPGARPADRDGLRRPRGMGAAAHDARRLDEPGLALPPRTAGAAARVQSAGPAAAPGLRLMARPRLDG